MTNALQDFFSAWAEADGSARADILSRCVSDDVTYSDPRAPEPVTGRDALNDMLGHFSANMSDASAAVAGDVDGNNGFMRAAISFSAGGAEMMRGQYFAHENADGKLDQIVGFMGMGDST